MMSFYAYPGFDGGVNVAAGNYAGSGAADIITSPAGNGPAHIKVFNFFGQLLASFIANSSTTGANIAAGVFPNSGGLADILVGPTSGTGPIQVFAGGTGALVTTFNSNFTGPVGGLRLGVGDATNSGHNEILIGAGPGTNAVVEVFDPSSLTQVGAVTVFDGFMGGIFVS
jgi:serralysin